MNLEDVKPGDIWYRLDDVTYAPPVDEFDNTMGVGRLEIVKRTFEVVRITAKGLWVKPAHCAERFILFNATKRHCHPTLALALESFVARKSKQASIYQQRANTAARAASMAQSQFGHLKPIQFK